MAASESFSEILSNSYLGMICNCNKTIIYCLQQFPTISLKSSVIIARIPSEEKTSIVEIYIYVCIYIYIYIIYIQ